MTQGLRQSPGYHPGIQAGPRAPFLPSCPTTLLDLPARAASKFCAGLMHVSRRLSARLMQARYSGLWTPITYGFDEFGGHR